MSRGTRADPRVDLARVVVLAELVVRDHEVELSLGVVRVQYHGLLEVRSGGHQVTLGVADHTEHVLNVGEAIGVNYDLTEAVLSLGVLALRVVVAAKRQQLFDALVHT